MMTQVIFRLLLVAACGLAAASASAADLPLRRTILALYDSRVEPAIADTRIHRYAEAPLNHLGLVVTYHDIAKGMPGAAAMVGVRGVLSWYASGVAVDATEYLRWAAASTADGRSFVILGDPGIRLDGMKGADAALSRQFTSSLGFLPTGRYRPGPHTIQILSKTPEMVEFERRLTGPLSGFQEFKRAPGATSYLEVRLGEDTDTDSSLVVTGKQGGMVAAGYEIFTDPRLGYVQWRLNPFEFFRVAFATDDLPKPDPATASGRRAFYALVDGDGWRDVTRLPQYRKTPTLCAEVVLDTILRPNADIPFTVAAIAGDLDDGWHGSGKARDVAKRIASLPNVEIASHTLSHPFVWSRYQDAPPAETKDEPASPTVGSVLTGGKAEPAMSWRERQAQLGSDASSPAAYRAYADAPFDLAAEISGSIGIIDTLLAGRKRVALLTWSGDTQPYEEALVAADTAGVANLNGGFAGYHQSYMSITSTSPVGRRVGNRFQVYGGNGGEAAYTNRPGDSLPGRTYLTRVLSLTEIPRRLRPATVYWQMYAAQDFATLNGVLTELEQTQRLEVAPVTAATYARMASGFNTANIIKVGERVWRVENRSALSTIRFDSALSLAVDFTRSRGVIGQRHYQGSLYVYLDGAEPAPLLALTDQGGSAAPPRADRPYLVHSRWAIEQLAMDRQGFEFAAKGFGLGDMVWQVPDAGTYEIVATSATGKEWRETATATSTRLIRFAPPDSPAHQAKIRVNYRRGQT
jgi:hypothetical protein